MQEDLALVSFTSAYRKVVAQGMFDNDTLLLYHNAAYPALADCKAGSDHAQPSGKRTHVIQLNKAATFVISM